jgi:hypothetical protein
VRANGESLLLFNRARQRVATTLLRRDGLVTFTQSGWFTSTGDVARIVRAFRGGDQAMTTSQTARFVSQTKVLAALHADAK